MGGSQGSVDVNTDTARLKQFQVNAVSDLRNFKK